VSLAQLGIAHLEDKQFREALIAFRDALEIRRSVFGSKHPKVAKIWNNIGCALFELQELKGAHLAFEEALDIQRGMMKKSSVLGSASMIGPPNQVLLSIASTLCNLGSIKLRWGEFDEAAVALEEALLVSWLYRFPFAPFQCFDQL